MKAAPAAVVGVACGLGLGLLLGRAQPVEAPEAPVAATAPAPEPAGSLRCVVPEPDEVPLAEAAMRLQMCERVLDAQSRPSPVVDLVVGAPSEAEEAEGWTERVDAALKGCGREGLEVAECSRYPCVGLLVDEEEDTGLPPLADCVAGVLKERGLPDVTAVPVEVSCGGGRVETVTVLAALDPESDASMVFGSGGSVDSFMAALVYFGGRVQDATSLWPCPEP